MPKAKKTNNSGWGTTKHWVLGLSFASVLSILTLTPTASKFIDSNFSNAEPVKSTETTNTSEEPEPAYEEPAYEEPAYEEPAYEEPAYEEDDCDPNYSGCVPNVSYDLDCPDIGFSVEVYGNDRHRFDGDGDGYGCESYY